MIKDLIQKKEMIKDLIQKDLDWSKPIQQVIISGKKEVQSVVDVVHSGQLETNFGLIHFVNFKDKDHLNTLIFNDAGVRIGSICNSDNSNLGSKLTIVSEKDYKLEAGIFIWNKKEPKKVVKRILIHDDGGMEVFDS